MENSRGTNLTQGQTLIWTGQQLSPASPLYNMALAFTIEGSVQRDLFEEAFRILVSQSSSLRTVVEEVEGIAQQRVLDKLDLPFEYVDLSDQPSPSEALREWATCRCQRIFDLAGCTFDTALIKLSDTQYTWYYNQHHVVTDASSFGILFRRMQEIYAALSENRRDELATLPPLPEFEAYVAYEQIAREKNEASQQWFDTKTSLVRLPLYGNKSSITSTATRRLTLRLGQERSEQLRTLAMQKDVRSLTRHMSQFNLILTVLYALLYRISGQRSLAIGAPAHNRPTRAFKETLGLFIEVFPLSVEIEADETFDSLLQKVKAESNAFLRYAQPGASDAKYQRSFNTLLNYITASFGDFAGLPMNSEWFHSGHCDRGHVFRLQVHDFDDQEQLVFHFDFNEEVFNEGRPSNAIEHFQRLFEAMLADRFQCLDAVDLLTEREKNFLFEEFNGTQDTVSSETGTVVEQFLQQAARLPAATALVCGSKQCNYAELERRVNVLSQQLRLRGIGKGTLVGICLHRSQAAVVAMLAIQKAGAAYVPIDILSPQERIAFILEDAQTTLVLTQSDLRDRLPDSTAFIILDDEGNPSELSDLSTGAASTPPELEPNDPAYMIYTSGSTGRPKGVVIPHRCLSHYIGWANTKYVQSRTLSFPLFSPLSFDLTVTSIFLPLVTGGQIVIYPESDRQADLALLHVIDDNLVDIIKLTPSHLALLQDQDLQTSRVKQLILGGEDLRRELAETTYHAFGDDVAIHNEYGPTEATVGCIVHTFDPTVDPGTSVPIGRPIRNMQAYVLNSQLQPMPQGVIGELFVAGDGLADGYWNRPELSAEKFIDNPFSPGCLMYRTGDLVRIGDDGNMEYLGRTDHQVKIGGVRIELGEIEAAVAAHPEVESCVVDFANHQVRPENEDVFHCQRCGLPSNYPDSTFDASGTCHLCVAFEAYQEKAQQYFRTMDDLHDLFELARQRRPNGEAKPYDCISLLSGGKDSTYVLCRLVDMGLNVLAFTLDNGYISDQAKANIDRVVQTLGVDHLYGSTSAMNEIFVDSLQRHANVCQGCFKTIYTLSIQEAKKQNIPFIVTGLSRGQFFETRLTEELFTNPAIDADQIDAIILRARKEYHRVDDAVSRLLDVEIFQKDRIFDEVQFVDFYRFCDVSLDSMLAYLDERVPWIRPSDTGRSTNCLINDVGIHVHKKERGFHNYAFPYSWDVRVGHKQRDAALEELDDEIDVSQVNQILEEVGYTGPVEQADKNDRRLVAYYVSPNSIPRADLLSHASTRLPEYMIPTHVVHLDALPLTLNGKVDRTALPGISDDRPELAQTYVAPRSEPEKILANIWQEVLRIERVGVLDNFFDLGGDSIMAIRIVAKANQQGLQLNPTQFFDALTIEKLATLSRSTTVLAEQGIVTGEVTLTPIQRWYFDDATQSPPTSQVFVAQIPLEIDVSKLSAAFQCLVRHHDALRISYQQEQGIWRATNLEEVAQPKSLVVNKISKTDDRDALIDATVIELNARLSLTDGILIEAALISCGKQASELVLVAHHLAVDAVSWPILLEDLFTSYEQLMTNASPQLTAKTTSFRDWSGALAEYAESVSLEKEQRYWQRVLNPAAASIPFDEENGQGNFQEYATDEVCSLDAESTKLLLESLPTKNRRVHEILLAAVGQTLTDWVQRDVIQIDVESHGRESFAENLDVSRTVGWFTSIYPLTLTLPKAASQRDESEFLTEMLAVVADQVRAVPRNGFSYGLLRYLRSSGSIKGYQESDVLFNYLGRAELLLAEDSPLKFSRELQLWRSPQTVRRHQLEINAMVVNEQLQVTWTYNRRRYHSSTIQQLAAKCQANLIRFIKHAHELGSNAVSAADFPQANINAEKLKKLSALLGKVDSR